MINHEVFGKFPLYYLLFSESINVMVTFEVDSKGSKYSYLS